MYKYPKYLFLLTLLFFISFIEVVAQYEDERYLEQGYHVVVGVFEVHDNAKRYTETLSQKGMIVSYGFNIENGMYYVVTGNHSTLETAIREAKLIRHNTAFHDAWVKSFGYKLPLSYTSDQNSQQTSFTSTPPEDSILLKTEPEETIVQHGSVTLENTEVFLSLFNAKNNQVIEGKVKVIDPEKNKLITEVDGNKYLTLPPSLKGFEKLILICEITGFRKAQLEINYSNPLQEKENPGIELFGTAIVVNFEMVPYVKGDIITLYNVYFYNDAAVMQPESQFELNQVVQMMKDNPDQRIRLHGHTNGNYTGQIFSIGPDKNYFSLQNAEKKLGTARDLAERRAQIIKDYLVDNNIDKNRIEIKSWGGKRPLHDKHSTRAKLNVRVEVEVL